jgi:hypothetical protein
MVKGRPEILKTLKEEKLKTLSLSISLCQFQTKKSSDISEDFPSLNLLIFLLNYSLKACIVEPLDEFAVILCHSFKRWVFLSCSR